MFKYSGQEFHLAFFSYLSLDMTGDGHDKPFCTEAIPQSIISKKSWAILIIIDTSISQFLKAISVIVKLSPISFSIKCCVKFAMCLMKFVFINQIVK